MTLSNIINSITSPVNVREVNTPIASGTLQSERTATGNGTEVTITGAECLIVKVTGTFVARLVPRAKYTGGSFVNVSPLYYVEKNKFVAAITGPGTYLYDNTLNKYDIFIARVEDYTSGAVSATLTSISKDIYNFLLPKHIILGSKLGQSIAASGSNSIVSDLATVKDFAFVYVSYKANAEHAKHITLQFLNPENTLGATNPAKTILSNSDAQNISDWIEVKGSSCTLKVYNDDSENSHTYDVYLYGVR